jgi:hypothetical protein
VGLRERSGRVGKYRKCQYEQPRGYFRGPASNPDKTPPIHAFCVGRNRGNFKPLSAGLPPWDHSFTINRSAIASGGANGMVR